MSPYDRGAFTAQFAGLAKDAGIVFSGPGTHGVYRDVAPGAPPG